MGSLTRLLPHYTSKKLSSLLPPGNGVEDVELEAYVALLCAVEVVGAAGFSYIAMLFYRLYRVLGISDLLSYALLFTLLAASQAAATASAIIPDPRAAASLYTATSSLAAAGFLAYLAQAVRGRIYFIAPGLVIVSMDFAAAVISTASAAASRGRARIFLSLLSSTYYCRALAALNLPSPEARLLLLAAETARAVVAASMAAYYAATAVPGNA